MEDHPESSEFHNLLKCTELLQTEDLFRSAVKVEPGAVKKRFKSKQVPVGSNGVKKLRTGSTSATAQSSTSKPNKPTAAWNPRANPAIEKVLKAAAKPSSPEKRKLSRPRVVSDEGPTIREIIVVDEQSVVPLSDVNGDMDFEDLFAEDLEICRYLPPVGNVQSGMKCAEISRRLKAFEQSLNEISQNVGKISTGDDDTEHDSDATLSIVSDEDASASQSSAATNPPVNVSMLEGYKIVFDPPVPAVITIPTSILRVNNANDWETEARALQFLMKKNRERRKTRTKPLQKPTVNREGSISASDAASKRREIAQKLFAAIEFKSNQVVSLDRPNFTVLHPTENLKKPLKERKRKSSEGNAVNLENPPLKSKDEKFVRLSNMVEKLELDPFSKEFLENNFQFIEEKQLRSAMRKHNSFQKAWSQILLVTDESLQKELHQVLQEARDELRRLNNARERSLLVTVEKCLLDQDETEKRLATNTEKAKSHVINMFEENRRQFELQRTLDFATCKCDMLAINTRNMRKRTDAPHVRLLEEMTGNAEGNRNQNPSASPPQTAQVMLNAPQSGFPSVQRRRRNQFAVALKEPLEDRDVYEDLASINRILKELPEREKVHKIMKSVEVISDENRLTVDGKTFYRNQQVTVEHHEHGRYSGVLVQFSQNDFLVKRTTDGKTERRRYALGLLADRRVTLRRRSAANVAR